LAVTCISFAVVSPDKCTYSSAISCFMSSISESDNIQKVVTVCL
jgi:hypothetical protein